MAGSFLAWGIGPAPDRSGAPPTDQSFEFSAMFQFIDGLSPVPPFGVCST